MRISRGIVERARTPLAAIVRSVDGGEWIYESLGDGEFCRRRVEVETIVDGEAILSHAPDDGTEVVVRGAAELFGAEFYVSH